MDPNPAFQANLDPNTDTDPDTYTETDTYTDTVINTVPGSDPDIVPATDPRF